VVAAAHERTTRKYGQRGVRYVHMEAGHAAQNIHLQAVALNLGTVVVGAFDDDKVKIIVNLSGDEQPLCLLPIGRIK
jgi:SagB-type dehydrogenase family enzyme